MIQIKSAFEIWEDIPDNDKENIANKPEWIHWTKFEKVFNKLKKSFNR